MSTFSRRITCALTTVIVTSVLSAGSTATAGAPRLPGVEDPNFEKPTVGECHNYGLAVVDQFSDSSPVVPCGSTHTAMVIATAPLPGTLEWETATETQLRLAIVKACLPEFRSILGRTEKLRQKSAYNISWFAPTTAQREAGARWLRCDLILEGGYSLQPIKRNVAPILQAYPLPNAVASCIVGGDLNLRRTVCSKTHRYRATGTYLVQRTYFPGGPILFDIAKRECPSRVSTPRYWYALYMDRESWLAGDRTITCYTHTAS